LFPSNTKINWRERERGVPISIYASDRFQLLRTFEFTLISRSCSERAILSQIGSQWQAAFTCFGDFAGAAAVCREYIRKNSRGELRYATLGNSLDSLSNDFAEFSKTIEDDNDSLY